MLLRSNQANYSVRSQSQQSRDIPLQHEELVRVQLDDYWLSLRDKEAQSEGVCRKDAGTCQAAAISRDRFGKICELVGRPWRTRGSPCPKSASVSPCVCCAVSRLMRKLQGGCLSLQSSNQGQINTASLFVSNPSAGHRPGIPLDVP